MSDHMQSQELIDTVTIRGRALNIELTTWKDHDGESWDVSDAATGFALHDESLDDQPSTATIEALIETLEDGSALALDPLFFDPEEVAAFVASLAPKTTP